MIETLEDLRGFVVKNNGLVLKIGKIDLSISMYENVRAIWVCWESQQCDCILVSQNLDKATNFNDHECRVASSALVVSRVGAPCFFLTKDVT